jgi:ribosomal-protein-alanine N-acetyltransferase
LASATLPETILTPRLLLRRPDLNDSSAVFHAFGGDQEIAETMLWPVHSTIDDSERYLSARISAERDGAGRHWLITSVIDHSVLGMISLLFAERGAEVGFLVSRNAWGNGFATEALKAVLDAGLTGAQGGRVWGWCRKDNGASARVMTKAGMRKEFFPRRYGKEYKDTLVFARGGRWLVVSLALHALGFLSR